MLVLSCSKNKPRRGCGEYEVCNITAVDVDMDSTCMADIYDMEIIKLENTKKSLISQVHKLIVNSKGILVYDNSSVLDVGPENSIDTNASIIIPKITYIPID